jgi:hypothetical protein
MAGLAPGAIVPLMTYNHGTGRFDVIGTASVRSDGALIVSDPGSGITLAGWGAPPPPGPEKVFVNDPDGDFNGCGPESAGAVGPPCSTVSAQGSVSPPPVMNTTSVTARAAIRNRRATSRSVRT